MVFALPNRITIWNVESQIDANKSMHDRTGGTRGAKAKQPADDQCNAYVLSAQSKDCSYRWTLLNFDRWQQNWKEAII